MRQRGGRTAEGPDNPRGISINGIHLQVPARWVTSRLDVGAVNNLLSVVGKNFVHKVTNGFTDTNLMAVVFMTVRGRRCIIHMVVYWLIQCDVKEGVDGISHAICDL
jgi:hypothetical protein